MGCSNCGSNSSGVPNGCKSNGSCGTGGCGKLAVFDWLANIDLPEIDVVSNVWSFVKDGKYNICLL